MRRGTKRSGQRTSPVPHRYGRGGGRTWRIGFVDASYDGFVNANESATAELPDGGLHFHARDQHGTSPGNHADAYSADDGRSLARPYAPQPALDAMPVVQAGLLRLPGPDGPLLYSGPSAPDRRVALALWASRDGGRTATRTLTLSARPAASPYESIEFRRVPLATAAGTPSTGAPSG
ncbi:exo-alpha-sialidase [Streptomyces sp. NPDC048604]|uniref:exo-alpha-sialidase n=1 Tax=Streptomyces sp. NPDC048604 TaxID=3365578 RepID=UPI00371D1071